MGIENKIVYIVMGLLLLVSAYGVTFQTLINDSQLPFTTSFNITVFTTNNTEIQTNHTFKSQYANITFTPIHNTFNGSSVNATFNYSISFFVNITPNPHTIIDNFTLINNQTGATTDVSVYTNVTFILSNVTQNSSQTQLSVNGAQAFFIRTFDIILPQTSIHNITVNARSDILVETTCTGNFIVCPGNFNTNVSSNNSIILVSVSIPNGTSNGNYTNFLIFKQQNTTLTVTFDVEIGPVTDQIRSITEIIAIDRCAQSPEDAIKCFEEQAKYNAQLAQKIIDQLKSKGQCTNETIEKEKFVVVGNVDEEIFKEQQRLRNENQELSSQIIQLNDGSLTCQQQMTDLTLKYASDTQELQLQSMKNRDYAETTLEKEQGSFWRSVRNWTVVLFIFGAVCIGVYYSGRNMWWW